VRLNEPWIVTSRKTLEFIVNEINYEIIYPIFLLLTHVNQIFP
jgi:hypothetical protein